MPCTPISPSASRTSSSLNGFNTAVISFIGVLLVLACTAVEQQPHGAPLSGMQEKGQPGETRFYWEKEEKKRFARPGMHRRCAPEGAIMHHNGAFLAPRIRAGRGRQSG